MIDIHSHLIPNVDDGSRSVEETVKMIKEARHAGFTDIILTSHYMEECYEPEEEVIELWTEQLQKVIDNESIEIKLYTGNEVYITENVIELLKNNKVATLANSRYLLIELPLNSNVKYAEEVIFHLKSLGIIPIIAHPERYSYIQKDITEVENLIKQGCLIQSNFGSIIGIYGKEAKKAIHKLLKNDVVHFLGSDCHKPNTIYKNMQEIMKELNKIISRDQIFKITVKNPKMILEDKYEF